ncbi:MAG: glycerophosphodiester phosphodiesterase family protein [Myxococcota bacterium]|jgi:glycerophosphoryl diester phosphodiesterase|nr:glycerophosphodiester phosphodiesterase family protein [Myxococcota bacterium]
MRPNPPFAAVVGPAIIAHRGGSLEAPENTLAALKHGIDVGSDWQEIDVQFSADDIVVLMHDDTLERTSDGQGGVNTHSAAKLATFHVGTPQPSTSMGEYLKSAGQSELAFKDKYKSERVPSLAQALVLPDARLMIEIKRLPKNKQQKVVDAVIAEIYSAKMEDHCAIGSFDFEILEKAYNTDPSIPLIGIAEDVKIEKLLSLPLNVWAVHKAQAKEALKHAPAGVAVWVWTVYSLAEAVELRNLGVHGIITDVPQAVVGGLRKPESLYIEHSTDVP